MPVTLRFVFFILLAFWTVACTPISRTAQPEVSMLVSLQPGETLGQTFVSRYRGLAGVAIWVQPDAAAGTQLTLHVRSTPESTEDLRTETVDLPLQPGFVTFSFAPLNSPLPLDGYFFLEANGKEKAQIGSAPGGAYLHGARYHSHQPEDAQLTFHLRYDITQFLLGLAGELVGWLIQLAAVLFLFALPGWSLLALLGSDRPGLSWEEKLLLSAGLGLAVTPLLFLWADLASLHPGPVLAWLSGALAGVFLLYRRFRAPQRDNASPVHPVPDRNGRLPRYLFLIVASLVIASRLWNIQAVDAPMFGDSVQHAVMTQRMLEAGGLFDSWLPYAPYQGLTIHFGFSAQSAVFGWLTRIPGLTATLFTGQWVNILAVLGLYPLAVRLSGGNRWAGVGAVLLAGLLSPMPAYYVNWGRYAQLAGQAILPAALWLALEALDNSVGRQAMIKRALLAGAALAGMALCYYRMPFYYAAFLGAWLLGKGLATWRGDGRRWVRALWNLLGVGTAALLLALPWLPRFTGSQLAGYAEGGAVSAAGFQPALQAVLSDFSIWAGNKEFLPLLLLLAGAAGWVWSLLRRDGPVIALPLWFGLLMVYIGSQMLGVPGAHMLQNFALLIAAYLPLSLLGGYAVGQAAVLAPGAGRRAALPGGQASAPESWRSWQTALAALLAVATLWGAWQQRAIAQPEYFALVTRPDLRAMEWIRANTDPQARFLVESFPTYGGASAVGADAGWWLPLLSGRQNTLPPQYAMLNEQPIETKYTQQAAELVTTLQTSQPWGAAEHAALCAAGVTHAYVGQGQGQVGYVARQLFSPQSLALDPAFQLVYHQDRVYVFALRPGACG